MGGAYEGVVDQMRQRIGLVAVERGVDHAARPALVAGRPVEVRTDGERLRGRWNGKDHHGQRHVRTPQTIGVNAGFERHPKTKRRPVL